MWCQRRDNTSGRKLERKKIRLQVQGTCRVRFLYLMILFLNWRQFAMLPIQGKIFHRYEHFFFFFYLSFARRDSQTLSATILKHVYTRIILFIIPKSSVFSSSPFPTYFFLWKTHMSTYFFSLSEFYHRCKFLSTHFPLVLLATFIHNIILDLDIYPGDVIYTCISCIYLHYFFALGI